MRNRRRKTGDEREAAREKHGEGKNKMKEGKERMDR